MLPPHLVRLSRIKHYGGKVVKIWNYSFDYNDIQSALLNIVFELGALILWKEVFIAAFQGLGCCGLRASQFYLLFLNAILSTTIFNPENTVFFGKVNFIHFLK